MPCDFNLEFSGPASIAIGKAKAAIESQNGIFNGDESSGNFEVTILGNSLKGNYTISGKILNLIISDKPVFIPCSAIESLLLKQIS